MMDGEIKNKSGIYWYVMDGNEQHLDLRTFDEKIRRETYERQRGKCHICGEHFEFNEMHADHIKPWCKGGRTVAENCQMLCRKCNQEKGGK